MDNADDAANAERQAHELRQLTIQYAGWRFGVGGSGHWWAVRRNEFLRALSPDELRAQLQRYLSATREA